MAEINTAQQDDTAKDAAAVLEAAHDMYTYAPGATAEAAALLAIAEQLALANTHLAKLVDNISYYVGNKV